MSPRGKEQNDQMRSKAIEKITSAALDVFAEYGYNGATIKKITGASGLSYGLVYHYFPSKEKIFRHLIDIALESTAFIFNKAFDISGTAWQKIENLAVILLKESLNSESSKLFHIMLQALTQGKSIPGLLEHIEKHSQTVYQKFIPLIVQAQESGEVVEGDPVMLAAAYLSFVQGLALFSMQDSKIRQKVTPGILTNILRNRGDSK